MIVVNCLSMFSTLVTLPVSSLFKVATSSANWFLRLITFPSIDEVSGEDANFSPGLECLSTLGGLL